VGGRACAAATTSFLRPTSGCAGTPWRGLGPGRLPARPRRASRRAARARRSRVGTNTSPGWGPGGVAGEGRNAPRLQRLCGATVQPVQSWAPHNRSCRNREAETNAARPVLLFQRRMPGPAWPRQVQGQGFSGRIVALPGQVAAILPGATSENERSTQWHGSSLPGESR
jgi:hypothetical protein